VRERQGGGLLYNRCSLQRPCWETWQSRAAPVAVANQSLGACAAKRRSRSEQEPQVFVAIYPDHLQERLEAILAARANKVIFLRRYKDLQFLDIARVIDIARAPVSSK
jgi:hypothetical protein